MRHATSWKQTWSFLTLAPFPDGTASNRDQLFWFLYFADRYRTDKMGLYQIIQSGCGCMPFWAPKNLKGLCSLKQDAEWQNFLRRAAPPPNPYIKSKWKHLICKHFWTATLHEQKLSLLRDNILKGCSKDTSPHTLIMILSINKNYMHKKRHISC